MGNKVLIIGLGSIARKHVNALRLLNNETEFFALRSSRDAKQEEGITDIYHTDEIPDDIKFGIISSPTDKHLDALDILIEKKIPAFIEKPIYHRLGPCYDYEKKISDANLFNYVACNLRFLNGLRFLKEYVNKSDERINEVNVYCGSFLPSWRAGNGIKNYSYFDEKGGGVHMDLFHETDYCCWIFGQPETNRNILRKVSTLHIDAADYANINLIYPQFTCNIVLNYYRKTPRRTIEIVFENSSVTLDIYANRVIDDAGNIIFEDNSQKIIDTYHAQMAYFTKALAADTLPENNFRKSLKILEICLSNCESF